MHSLRGLSHRTTQRLTTVTMKTPSIAFASAILVSILALSQSGVISDAPAEVAPYSIIDPIIKAILEAMKPKLANLKVNDINQTISNPNLNGTIIVDGILIKNLDKFVTKVLKSNMVPLKLTNLTLTWADISATARYDIDTTVRIPQFQGPIRLFAKGNAGVVLRDLFVTLGANMEMKNNAIQIKPKGIFGFDISIKSANVTVSSILGSQDLGKAVGVFVGTVIPELVNTLKKPVFDALQDDIIKMVNDVLKKNGTSSIMDEYVEQPQEFIPDSADLSQMDSFFAEPLELGLEYDNNEFNFDF